MKPRSHTGPGGNRTHAQKRNKKKNGTPKKSPKLKKKKKNTTLCITFQGLLLQMWHLGLAHWDSMTSASAHCWLFACKSWVIRPKWFRLSATWKPTAEKPLAKTFGTLTTTNGTSQGKKDKKRFDNCNSRLLPSSLLSQLIDSTLTTASSHFLSIRASAGAPAVFRYVFFHNAMVQVATFDPKFFTTEYSYHPWCWEDIHSISSCPIQPGTIPIHVLMEN